MNLNNRNHIAARTTALAFIMISAVCAQTLGPNENGMSLQGSRLTYYQRPAAAQCQNDCANNPNCQGFTWINPGTYNRSDPGMCYLLSSVTGRVPAAGHISGVKGGGSSAPSAPAGTESGMSLTGTTLTYYQRPTAQQCDADCANNPNCKGFTWIAAGTYRPNDAAMCYLLSAVTGRSPARGHISGIKQGATGNGGATPPSGLSIAGFWQWRACNDEYGLLIGIETANGVNFTGGFENANGTIKNGVLRGDRIEFDRDGGSWQQHYSGQVVNDGGKLKIVNGAWSGAYADRCPGRMNWHAEKQ